MFVRYEPRPLEFLGIEHVAGHRLKLYSIRHGGQALDRTRFAGAWKLVGSLPPPDAAGGRPGLGFAILHQGATGDYLILCWWDAENELPTRVFVTGPEGWRSSTGESFCVWDLRVMWWEREAYVATMLSGRDDSTEAYLAATAAGYA